MNPPRPSGKAILNIGNSNPPPHPVFNNHTLPNEPEQNTTSEGLVTNSPRSTASKPARRWPCPGHHEETRRFQTAYVHSTHAGLYGWLNVISACRPIMDYIEATANSPLAFGVKPGCLPEIQNAPKNAKPETTTHQASQFRDSEFTKGTAKPKTTHRASQTDQHSNYLVPVLAQLALVSVFAELCNGKEATPLKLTVRRVWFIGN